MYWYLKEGKINTSLYSVIDVIVFPDMVIAINHSFHRQDTDMIATTLSMSKKRKERVDFSIPFDVRDFFQCILSESPVDFLPT